MFSISLPVNRPQLMINPAAATPTNGFSPWMGGAEGSGC